MTGNGVAGVPVAEVPVPRRVLADRIRELVEASLLADDSADFDDLAARIVAVTEDLRTPTRRGYQAGVNNPVEGPGNPLAPPLGEFVVDGRIVRGTATLGVAHEGAPGRAHGGWVAALLDHAVGRAAAVGGPPAMTVSLTVDYLHGTPYGVPLDVEAEVAERDGRKVHTVARIRADGRITATASAVLVTVRGLPVSPD